MKKLWIAAMLAGLVLAVSGCGNVVATESDGTDILAEESSSGTEAESGEEPEKSGETEEESSEEPSESVPEGSESAEAEETLEDGGKESTEVAENSKEPEEKESTGKEAAEKESESGEAAEKSGESQGTATESGAGGNVPTAPAPGDSGTAATGSSGNSGTPESSAGNTTAGSTQGGNNSQSSNNNQTASQPAHTHTYVTQTVSEATCEQAKVVRDVCSGCGDVRNERTEGSALGHDYQGYWVWREATCTTSGSAGQTCTRCGANTVNIIIPQLDHEYEATVIVEGNCNGQAHEVKYTCKNCGSFYTEVDPSYHANDHTWVLVEYEDYDTTLHQWVTKEKTVCSVCNREKE